MKANYKGRNATVKKDEWGFTMANFRVLLPFGYESIAFPIHCQQVFFSEDEDEPGWKVVLPMEVRGRRIDSEVDQEDEPEMFAMGRDVDFEGLREPSQGSEFFTYPSAGGKNIDLNNVLNDSVEENAMTFERDLGESTEDDK